MLPRFGSGRNPFREAKQGRVDDEEDSGATVEPAAAESATKKVAAAGSVGSGADKRQKVDGRRTRASEAATSDNRGADPPGGGVRRKEVADKNVRAPALARAAGLVRPFGEWVETMLGRVRRPRRSAIPRFDRPAVQAELSLDRVKVMRNDLSDTDVELVPAKLPVSGPEPSTVRPELGGGKRTGTAWGRMSARLLGAGKT